LWHLAEELSPIIIKLKKEEREKPKIEQAKPVRFWDKI